VSSAAPVRSTCSSTAGTWDARLGRTDDQQVGALRVGDGRGKRHIEAEVIIGLRCLTDVVLGDHLATPGTDGAGGEDDEASTRVHDLPFEV
jgi:hypothetical protein